jgi:transcriptional regulator with PAS, ATPase and Fis domain
MTDEKLLESLKTMIKNYKKVIDEIVFAWPERELLKNEPETPREILETLQGILNCSKELNQVMEQSPSSIFVADSAGKTIRINKAFEYVAQRKEKAFWDVTWRIEATYLQAFRMCSGVREKPESQCFSRSGWWKTSW